MPPPVAVVTALAISPTAPVVERGLTIALSVDVRDQFGVAMPGQAVTWASSNVAVASVDVNTGVATGNTIGTTNISATVLGRSASVTITVAPPPVVSVAIAPLAGPFAAGQITQLVVALRDRNGAILGTRQVAWSSSDAMVAAVDTAGKMSAVSVGTAVITAVSEGVSGTVTIVVTDGAGVVSPAIASISPSTLVPGTTATLAGTGFDALAANNIVTIRGATARITSASATQLVVTVPCVASGSANVQVTTNLRSGPAFAHPLAATQRQLAVGQVLVFPDVACSELPASASARYVVAMFSASPNENAVVDFELGGNPALAGASPAFVPASPLRTSELLAPGAEAMHDRAHWQMLERNRAILAEGRALTVRQPLLNRARVPTAVPAVGDRRDFYYTYTSGCRDTTRRIFGRVLYVGAHAIIWEDTANTLRAATEPALDDYYQRLGRIFDDDQYDIIRDNFGDPLRRDAATDDDGHLNMVFSEKLNGSGAAAFVTACDQFPTTTYAASNFGQLFYGSVPTNRTLNLGSTNSPDGWFNFMARTVVHEVKHIAALSARVANGASLSEESWLEEGTARHAEELWVRKYLHKVAWKGNTGYGSAATNGIFCDFHPENATCNAADALRRPGYGMRRHFNELRNKLLQPWNWSLYGDASGQGGSVFYQTSWSLVRYAIDRYGQSDAAFLTALTNSTSNGLTNLSALAGVTNDQLVGRWALALYVDDYAALAAPSADLQIATWNIRGIYASLNADATWSSSFSAPYLLQPVQLGFGSFTSQRTGLRGGAAAYFEISGAMSAPQMLGVRSITGNNPSANLRMAIARLQ